MAYRLTVFFLVTTCVLIFAACGVGPQPQSITGEPLTSGEDTAREAGEAADEDDRQGLIYASSKRGEERLTDEEPVDEEPVDEEPVDEEPVDVDEDQPAEEDEVQEDQG